MILSKFVKNIIFPLFPLFSQFSTLLIFFDFEPFPKCKYLQTGVRLHQAAGAVRVWDSVHRGVHLPFRLQVLPDQSLRLHRLQVGAGQDGGDQRQTSAATGWRWRPLHPQEHEGYTGQGEEKTKKTKKLIKLIIKTMQCKYYVKGSIKSPLLFNGLVHLM